MARTKEITKTNGNNSLVDDQGYFYLPRPLLMEYRALDSEFRHTSLSLRVVLQELNAMLTKHPEIAQKLGERETLIGEVTNKKNALVEVHRSIEQLYGVLIQNVAIDDVTGRMQVIVEGKPQVEDGQPVFHRPQPVEQVRTPRRMPKSRSAR